MRGLAIAALLGLATPAWAGVTLHFTFGLTREADACWDASDRVRYQVAGQTYETARADLARVEGACGPATEAPPAARAAVAATARAAVTVTDAPVDPRPTDAMLARGRVSLPEPAWSPPLRGGCRPRGVEAALHAVVDGDTIEVRVPGGHTEVVRYIGVNTPEVYALEAAEEAGGRAAMALNERLVSGKRLELAFDIESRDRHGRLLAYVYADGEHVNAALVEAGYAVATAQPPNVCFRERFEALERHARDGRRGLWAEPERAATFHSARELNVLAAPAADQPKP
jgi:endonuclease YncB( thermonuclease family)